MTKREDKRDAKVFGDLSLKTKFIFAMSVVILASTLSYFDKIGEYSYIFVLSTIGALFYTGKESLLISKNRKEEECNDREEDSNTK